MSVCLCVCLSGVGWTALGCWWLCVSLSLCLYLCLSISLSLCLSICVCVYQALDEQHLAVDDCVSVCNYVCLSVCLYVSMSVCRVSVRRWMKSTWLLMTMCLSITMSVSMYVCLSVSVSVYLSVCVCQALDEQHLAVDDCVSLCLYVCIYVCLSVCLSVCVSVRRWMNSTWLLTPSSVELISARSLSSLRRSAHHIFSSFQLHVTHHACCLVLHLQRIVLSVYTLWPANLCSYGFLHAVPKSNGGKKVGFFFVVHGMGSNVVRRKIYSL